MKKMIFGALLMALPVQADDSPYVEFKVLKPEMALIAAQAALTSCRDAGYQVGVMVSDRFGIPQVFLRDRFAGVHVFETARRKAWTTVSFRTNTTDLAVITQAGEPLSGLRGLSQALPLGGGKLIENGDGALLGAIAVSGAPGGDLDDACAEAGIAAIEDEIAF